MSFLSDISDAILEVDTGWNGDYGVTDINAMKRSGWSDGVAKQIAENASDVTSSTISGGSVASGTDSDWGLNHFKTDFKSALLAGTTLFPYKGEHPGFVKYMVIINANIHRFTDSDSAWFDATHQSVPDYCAAYFFDTKGESTNHDIATDNGDDVITGFTYPGT